MNSKERIAYLRGLLDFLPREEKETKIYYAIAEALESLALELEEHTKLLELQREDYDSLAEEMDELHEAVYNLEESVGLGDSDDEDYSGDDVDELGGLTESYISMTCPSCAYSFYYKYEEGKENDRLVCPSCGEEFNRSL
ncbi:MAG: transposase [Synergistaceae bacterium]|nr:transposase [Synergistaceae bacterium]